ncbi:MAG: aspartate aminotransferase-like enzyme [Paraglaciecola sp.]|jgi:aspartate aminotransferase-like enzyme|uniref:hypothetical protein n=1 Tax=uncultured Paraglaciecola sp. TaxID=1765024 RepID=UPI0025F4040B|nr:hypothetical protein [uncultured Paraglaciecola sp.]
MPWSFSHRLAEMAKRVEASVVRLKFEGKKTQIQMQWSNILIAQQHPQVLFIVQGEISSTVATII